MTLSKDDLQREFYIRMTKNVLIHQIDNKTYRECYYDFHLSYRNTAMADPLTAGVLAGLVMLFLKLSKL